MKNLKLPKPVLNKIVSFFAALTLLVIIFILTNPDNVSLAVLLIPFLLIGYLVYTFFSLLFYKSREPGKSRVMTRLAPLSIAFLVVVLLLLASLGQFTLRDGLLAVGFTAVFLAYVGRADFLK